MNTIYSQKDFRAWDEQKTEEKVRTWFYIGLGLFSLLVIGNILMSSVFRYGYSKGQYDDSRQCLLLTSNAWLCQAEGR